MNARFYQTFYPYFMAGAVVVIGIFAFFLLSILFIKALIIGGIIFIFAWIKNRFFPSSQKQAPVYKPHDMPAPSGRREPITFEHGEY